MSKKKGPEATMMEAVMAAIAKIEGVTAQRQNAGGMPVPSKTGRRFVSFGSPGTPDIVVMLPRRRVVWIELKVPGNTLTAPQVAWHQAALELGQNVVTAYSFDEAVNAVLDARDEALSDESPPDFQG